MNMYSTREELLSRFTIADYAIFIAMLGVSAAIGIYYACTGNKQKTTKDFFMGGQEMGVFPVAMSILASFMSAIPMLGIPAETYLTGTQFWMVVVAYCFMFPTVAYIYMPLFYKLGSSSVYEYLELRFSRPVRTICSTIFTIQMVLYMAIVMYAPSLALSQVTGLKVWFCVLSIGLVCTFYTTIGGMKAVVLTDLFQVFVIFGAMLVVVIKGSIDLGGMSYVWNKNNEGQRIEFFNFDFDPTTRHTVWSLAIGGFFTWLSIYGVSQPMVQRYLTIPSTRGAKIAIWLNLPGLATIVTVTTLAGLLIYTRYADCDPMKTKQVSAPDQLLPLYVMDTLGTMPCLPGIFVAGIFSGAISTVSSGVNALAAVTLEDIVKSYIKPDISEQWATRLAKILALSYGLACIVLVAVVERLGAILQLSLSVFGVIGGPILGVFTLGMFFPWANRKGALVGLITGIIAVLWIAVGAFLAKVPKNLAPVSVAGCTDLYYNVTGKMWNETMATNMQMLPDKSDIFVIYRISYMWYSAIGCLIVIIIGLIISFLTGAHGKDDVKKDLISPVTRKVLALFTKVKNNKSVFPVEMVTNNNLRNATYTPNGVEKGVQSDGVVNIAYINDPHTPVTAKSTRMASSIHAARM
ncbi:sodium-coupled monocarboxylate transporter 1-like [Argiope bruennichi]|uniref:sodium-coupled monocarboxylate transporter 1-like n=1 Tax=Argiope bruennichi TaxID=94029 RepID=UPI002495201A|nr:sodium-coupled monocarboxylate transporter 1-like [Argiope bruennichi]